MRTSLFLLFLCGPLLAACGSTPGGESPFGGAVRFDGKDDYIEIPHTANLNLFKTATFEAWVKLDRLSPDAQIFGKSKGTAEIKRLAILPNGQVRMTLASGGNQASSITGSMILTVGEWHHLAAVCDAKELRLYVDGARVGLESFTSLIRNSDGAMRIGRFAGTLDELRISTTARYVGNVFELPVGPFVNDKDTALLLHFDEGKGTITRGASHGVLGTLGTDAKAPQWVQSDLIHPSPLSAPKEIVP